MDKINITPATLNDAYGLQQVFYKSWLEVYPNKEHGITIDDIENFFKDAFTEETLRARTEKLENLPENMKVLVAKEGNKVIGMSRVILYPDKNQLQAIYLLPDYQGKGIGKMLWNESFKLFDKNKEAIVHVAIYNEKAINFYKKLGFVDNGKRFSEERFKMKSGALIPEMEMVIKALETHREMV